MIFKLRVKLSGGTDTAQWYRACPACSRFNVYKTEVKCFFFPLLWQLDTSYHHLGSGNLNWENASIRLVHRQICGSTSFIKMIVESPATVSGASPGQARLGVIKKVADHKQCFFKVFASVPASRFLSWLPFMMDYDGDHKLNKFFPLQVWRGSHIFLIESKLREKNNKNSPNPKTKNKL